ncbi:phytoene desaturase family protein [Ornithinimicrobium sp. F0845]|uniref:phytoene desaturase family protein n=1 Tax=Ornithinimicrobium sp. F0845 TaxID=2926412 RepID=UPI001FF2926D|nr:phytoene desaturase family protein [Ornithinimicrobium sp. F0845]MCK0113089.1 phytoene desaturase family protein [Ornithinimicrobium sp. F0845]
MSSTGNSVAIVGGGIAGLATAALLAEEGYVVELFEQRPAVGGRAGSHAAGGFRFDTGPSWYLMPEVFDHFFQLLGTSAQDQLDLHTLDPAYRVFFEGAPGQEQPPHLDVVADAGANAATFDQVEPGAGRRLTAYLRSAREVYDLALRRFLYTSFTAPTNLASPEVLAHLPRILPLLTRSLETLVASRFRDPRLRQVLGYPAVFLGSSPDRTPSLYHLMSALDLTGGVLYPHGGFSRLVEAVADLALERGVRIRTGATVTEVTTAAADRTLVRGRRCRARVTGVRWRDADGGEHLHRADVVVGAGDLHHLETRLLPEQLRTYPQRYWDRRTSGPGAVLVLLGVRDRLPQLPHHSLFFTHDWRANFEAISTGHVPDPASVYVCKPSATDPAVAPEGHENLFVLVPVPADPDLGRGGRDGGGDAAVEAIADRAVAQVARWADIPDLADRVVVRQTVGPGDFSADLSAWRGGMLGPAHTLRQSAMFRARNTSRHVAGLYYAGSSTIPGIGVPMCLISAELVLKHLRGDTSAGPSPVPTPARHRSGVA